MGIVRGLRGIADLAMFWHCSVVAIVLLDLSPDNRKRKAS